MIIKNEKKMFIHGMIPIGVTTLEGGCFLSVCEAWLDFTGGTRTEVIGRSWVDTGFVTKNQYDVFLAELAKKNQVENLEMTVRDKNGSVVLGLFNAAVLTLADRKCLWTVMTGTMERREAYGALLKSEQKYRLLVENINEGIWQIDKDAFTTFVNQYMAEMLGYTVAEMLGRHLFAFMDGENIAAARSNLARRQAGIKERLDFVFLRKDGSPLYTSLMTTPIIDKEGNYLGAIAGVQDITGRISVEEELNKHRLYLEEMIRERTVELESKNVTLQELNTTLKVLLAQRDEDKRDLEERFILNVRNLVLPYVEQMKKGKLEVEQKSYLEIIETHLKEIATPLLKNIRRFNLTPREMRVASLIKSGRTTKEIAKVMGSAPGSIDVHRKNIRKKLGLNNKKANLLSYLESLDQ
ncbi:MAG TPA: PAS domain S-box protein [Syntrophales bacterium]|nr:PAS domain S-box protein [Syntrophales bacterium]HPN09735.1 PAS domain S-box protein [Syntrophales bacterium]HPX81198.1 PAS domain S-box protein [Syntrophales bacterium]HQB14649.1 PAS domain S-box protein [Syntrophales bacterium]